MPHVIPHPPSVISSRPRVRSISFSAATSSAIRSPLPMDLQLFVQDSLHLHLLVGGREVGDGEGVGQIAKLRQQAGCEADSVLSLSGLAQVHQGPLQFLELALQVRDGAGQGFVLREPGHGLELDPERLHAVHGLAGGHHISAHILEEGDLLRDVSLAAECGSLMTVRGCSWLSPSTFRRTVYCPGGIRMEIWAPPAGRPSSPTAMCSAYIGRVYRLMGPLGSSRRSQWMRLTPSLLVPSIVRTTAPMPSTISTVGVSLAAAASQ